MYRQGLLVLLEGVSCSWRQKPACCPPQLTLSANSLKLGACSALTSACTAGGSCLVGAASTSASTPQKERGTLAAAHPAPLRRQHHARIPLLPHPLGVGRRVDFRHHLLQPLVPQHPPHLLAGRCVGMQARWAARE